MKYTIILATFLFSSCLGTAKLMLPEFQGQYNSFLEDGEEDLFTGYNFMKSKTDDGLYKMRTFFPETRQVTSELTYTGKKFQNLTGPAKNWHENGNLKSEGNLFSNRKSGIWKFYGREDGKLDQEGEYVRGEKNGLWKYYDSQGRLSSETTYSIGLKEGLDITYDSVGVVTSKKEYKSDSLYTVLFEKESQNNSQQFKLVEEMPYIASCKIIQDKQKRKECSNRALLEYIYKNLKYPYRARKNNVEGMAVAQFVVAADGTIQDSEVIVGLCQPIKDECQRVIDNMPKWIPGTQDGKAVKVLYTLPIRFKLEN